MNFHSLCFILNYIGNNIISVYCKVYFILAIKIKWLINMANRLFKSVFLMSNKTTYGTPNIKA